MKKNEIFFTLAFLLSFSFLKAQEKIVDLEAAVVTANMDLQKQNETGRNIISIKGELFSGLPVHSIDELLRYLPGIEVQQRGPQGSQSNIIIRGGTFQQVLVVIDGIKLNDPLTGHFTSYIPIHPSEIERIEILKGAASAIYGSEAVGGVIHIITKIFSGSKNPKPNTAKARTVIGSYELINADAYFNWSQNKSTISGGIISNNSNGQRLRGTNGFFNLTTANLAWSQELNNNWRISLRSAADFRKFNAQNFYTTFASDTAHEKVKSWWNHVSLRQKTDNGELVIDAAFKILRDKFWFNKTATPNDNKTNLFTTQLNYSFKLAESHGITTGAQLHRKEINSNDRGDHSLWHAAVYTVFRHRLGNNLYFNESLRLDWDENYGLEFIPQLNFAWSPSKFTFRASAGKSIRDADFTERFNNYNKAVVRSGSIGNPDLVAERSWNFEAGFDYSLTTELKISGTAFIRDQNDLIDWSPTAYADMPRKSNLISTGTYALAKNIANVKTSGIELDIIFRNQFSEKVNLFSTAGFTWLNSNNNNSTPSFYISSHAKYLVNFNKTLVVDQFSFSLTGLYKNRNEKKAAAIGAVVTPSYFILNSKAAYRFHQNKASVFLQADNIFDRSYSDILGAVMPGRWISGGIEIAL